MVVPGLREPPVEVKLLGFTISLILSFGQLPPSVDKFLSGICICKPLTLWSVGLLAYLSGLF